MTKLSESIIQLNKDKFYGKGTHKNVSFILKMQIFALKYLITKVVKSTYYEKLSILIF